MKRLLVSAAVLGLLTSAPAFAAPSSTASVGSSADIVTSITIAPDAQALNGGAMYFGHLAPPASGTVVVSVDASGNLTPGSAVPANDTGSPAQFVVTGQSGAAYNVVFGSGTSTSLVGPTGSTAMPFAVTMVGGAGSARTLTGGTGTIVVTGQLTVAAAQMAGHYTGTVQVTAAYN